MVGIIDSFRSGVPSSKQLYSKYSSDGITYKKFKKQFCDIIEIKKYILSMNNEDYLAKKEVHNVFKYLNNLKYNKFSDVKKAINILNDLRDSLKIKILDLNEKDIELFNSIKHILLHINMLKDTIADRIDLDIIELEKIINFENVTEKILKSDNINESLKLMFSNLELLSECIDFKGRDFNTLLYNSVYNAKNKKANRFLYYKNLLNYIINIKCLNLNKNEFYNLLGINDISFDKGILKRKIESLTIDKYDNRVLLDNEYIITVDNEIMLDGNNNIKSNATSKIDDGLSVEKTNDGIFILGIHIADVYSLGNFKDATEFFKTGVNFNKQKASLSANKMKNAISLFVEIDRNGIIRDYKILKTKIKANKNLVYGDISKIISEDNVCKELKETVIELAELHTIVDNNNFTPYPSIQNIGHSLVKKYMILYGCIVSECFIKCNIPGIFLCGDGRKNHYSTFADNYNSGFENYKSYSKATSPIYDKSSLMCQLLLHQYIFNIPKEETMEEITTYVKKMVDSLNKNH